MGRTLLIALMAATLAGCGSSPAPTASENADAPASMATTAIVTGVPEPTAAPAQSATDVPTSVPSAVATDTPAPTPAATPEPSPTEALVPTDLAVVVTSMTASVPRGSNARVSIKTTKGASCSIDVQYASGSSSAAGLGDATANSAGAISWTWKVGSRTTKGTWPINIACSLGAAFGSVGTQFTVT